MLFVAGCTDEPTSNTALEHPPSPNSILVLGAGLSALLDQLQVPHDTIQFQARAPHEGQAESQADCASLPLENEMHQAGLTLILAIPCAEAFYKQLIAREGDDTVLLINPGDINSVIHTLHELGRLTGAASESRRLVGEMITQMSRVATTRDDRLRSSVVWVVSSQPLTVVGGVGLLHELLELAGAENPFHEPFATTLQVTAAQIRDKTPDVILDSSGDPQIGQTLAGLPILHLPNDSATMPILNPLARLRQLHGTLYPGAQ